MSIRTAVLNGVATIEIARPEKKNAITGAMYHVDFGHQRVVSAVTADAAAKPTSVCPDGNDE